MELLAVKLKQNGSYLARQLVMKDVKFNVEVVPDSQGFGALYDECTTIVSFIYRIWYKRIS